MTELSSLKHTADGPELLVPRAYNAAFDLIERNLRAGRGAKTAYIDDRAATPIGNSPPVLTGQRTLYLRSGFGRKNG